MRQVRPWVCVLVAAAGLAGCGGGGTSGDPDAAATDPDAAIIDAAAIDARPIDAPAIDAPPTDQHFSFFVTSLKALRQLSGNQNGFGGDLRYGETGDLAGLHGADKICAAIAELSLPGSGSKGWHAFLSAAHNGAPVHAIDRLGNGPWYDRLGRLVASSKATLMADRPSDADPAIKNDFPNEDGVPNHNPDGTGQVDNHDFLTGTNTQGHLYAANATCLDWTAAAGNLALEGKPRVGHSWPRQGSGTNWMNSLTESGCAPGVSLIEMGGPMPGSTTVGSGGGYGGFYCFADTP